MSNPCTYSAFEFRNCEIAHGVITDPYRVPLSSNGLCVFFKNVSHGFRVLRYGPVIDPRAIRDFFNNLQVLKICTAARVCFMSRQFGRERFVGLFPLLFRQLYDYFVGSNACVANEGAVIGGALTNDNDFEF